jgi:hypothetical protein
MIAASTGEPMRRYIITDTDTGDQIAGTLREVEEKALLSYGITFHELLAMIANGEITAEGVD